MRAKTGRVASNGIRLRESEKIVFFSRLSTKTDIAPVLFAEGIVGRCVDTLKYHKRNCC